MDYDDSVDELKNRLVLAKTALATEREYRNDMESHNQTLLLEQRDFLIRQVFFRICSRR